MLRPLKAVLDDPADLMVVAAIRGVSVAPGEAERELAGRVEDWPRLCELAAGHRAGAALAALIRGLGALESLAPEAQRALLAAESEEFAGNLLMRARLDEVVRALNAAAVRPMLLKGALMDRCYYPPELPRGMCDLDLVVRPHDLAAAVPALEALGYHQHRGLVAHHVTLVQGTRVVELHHAEHRPPLMRSGVYDLWDGATELELDGLRAMAPDPMLHLLHIIVHFMMAHRMETGLHPLCDLAVLTRALPLEENGHELVRLARDTGVPGAVYWALCMAHEWLGVELPRFMLDDLALREPTASRQARLVERWFRDTLPHPFDLEFARDGLDNCRWDMVCTYPAARWRVIGHTLGRMLSLATHRTRGEVFDTFGQRLLYTIRPERLLRIWRRLWRARRAFSGPSSERR